MNIAAYAKKYQPTHSSVNVRNLIGETFAMRVKLISLARKAKTVLDIKKHQVEAHIHVIVIAQIAKV